MRQLVRHFTAVAIKYDARRVLVLKVIAGFELIRGLLHKALAAVECEEKRFE